MMMPYAKAGCGPKTLVILPGLSLKQVSPMIAFVEAQYQAFIDAGYTLYVFDRRTDAPEGYAVRDMARDTATLMKELGIERADVAGVSQGGMVALYLAADYPDLVDHLLLGSTCAHVDDVLGHAADTWIALAEAKREKELIESFGSLVYAPAVWEANKEAIMAVNANVTDEEYERFVRMARAVRGYDVRDRLGDIVAPTLVMGSVGDKVIPNEAARELASLLGCECHWYDASFGHAVYDEAPDYVERLLAFCQR